LIKGPPHHRRLQMHRKITGLDRCTGPGAGGRRRMASFVGARSPTITPTGGRDRHWRASLLQQLRFPDPAVLRAQFQHQAARRQRSAAVCVRRCGLLVASRLCRSWTVRVGWPAGAVEHMGPVGAVLSSVDRSRGKWRLNDFDLSSAKTRCLR